VEIKDSKFQEEVKAKIEQRLEKRKERLEKASEVIKNRDEKLQELENKNSERKEDRSGSVDRVRLERVDKKDED
jgi:hypothetical protein